MKRIAITGFPQSGKTIMSHALAAMSGFDVATCPPYPQLAVKYELSPERSKCQWPESFEYGLASFTERIIIEQNYEDRYISDGSVLNELVWLKCRYPQNELIYEQSMIHSLEHVVAEYTSSKYEYIFHLNAIDSSDIFDQCMKQTLNQYAIQYQSIDGSNKKEALKQIIDWLEIKPILSPGHSLLSTYNKLNYRNEDCN